MLDVLITTGNQSMQREARDVSSLRTPKGNLMRTENQSNYLAVLNKEKATPVWFTKPILYMLVALWLGINLWSTVVVAQGLNVSKNFESMPEWSLYLIAGALQAAIAMAPIYLSYFWRQSRWSTRLLVVPTLATAALSILFFEIAHQILIQTKSSQGAEMLNVHRSELDTLRNRVNDLGNAIVNLFEAKSKETASFAERAAHGKDGSGIALKGPIYRARIAQYDKTRLEYGDLAIPVGLLRESDDFRLAFSEIEARIETLKSKVARLSAFYRAMDGASAPISVTAELSAIENVVNAKRAIYKNFNDVSERSLAVAETFAIPNKIINGESIPAMYVMAIAYGLAPFVVSVLFSTYLRVYDTYHRNEGDSIADLQDQVHHEEQKLPLRERLVAMRMKQFGLRVRETALKYGDLGKVFANDTRTTSNDSNEAHQDRDGRKAA
jgi:hypothetical protein